MELQKVRGLLHRLLKVPAADLKLTYSSPKVRPQDLCHLFLHEMRLLRFCIS